MAKHIVVLKRTAVVYARFEVPAASPEALEERLGTQAGIEGLWDGAGVRLLDEIPEVDEHAAWHLVEIGLPMASGPQPTLPPAVVPGSPDGVKLEYPGKVPTQAEMVHLETLIDRCGLYEVLVALDVICGDKAAHIRANGTRSDNYLARRWEGAAKACRRAAGSKAVEYVDPSYPT